MNIPLNLAREVIKIEINAVEAMLDRMNEEFNAVISTILEMKGRVVILGMGKSGIVGQKIAATLASTGTPSFFVHPGEAFHGDLGMIKSDDIAIMISNSGESEEIIRLLPFLKSQGNTIIALTGSLESTLSKNSNHILNIGVMIEACANNLAPTSSTTCTLVMGDAIAVTLSKLKNFQPEDFARFHPGGSLGRKLLTRVKDVMETKNLPLCTANMNFKEVIKIITQGKKGIALVIEKNKLRGVITDGDVRRTLEDKENPLIIKAEEIMNKNPITIGMQEMLMDCEKLMIDNKINSVVVINNENEIVGILQLYDL